MYFTIILFYFFLLIIYTYIYNCIYFIFILPKEKDDLLSQKAGFWFKCIFCFLCDNHENSLFKVF